MKKRTVKPGDVIELLKKEGEDITIEQAQIVLDYMYKMAAITLSIFNDERCYGNS
jgi:hypothetical protein